MARTLLIGIGIALLAGGCTEKTELKALCASGKAGDRQFETKAIADAAALLRKAEEAEDIIRSLETRRAETTKKREALVAEARKQRVEAEAMSLDDKDARRKAILEVTAMEQDAQKQSEEISRYGADIDRNQATAEQQRRAATALLKPLLDSHGLTAGCQAVLTGKR